MITRRACLVTLLLLSPQIALRAQAFDSVARARECSNCAVWNMPQKPFRIYGNTYYVGPHGLSTILITSNAGHVLIDGALPESAPAILAHIAALGFRVQDIKVILNSHAHFDHAGGIAAMQRASGAQVRATAWSAEVLRRGTSIEGDPQLGIGLPYPGVSNVAVIRDGDTIRVGDIKLVAHVTAGHTPSGTTWTWQSCENSKCLDMVYVDSQSPASADGFLFTRNSSYPNAIADFRHGEAVIAALRCDILLTPHPDASNLWQRVAARDNGQSSALIDPNACTRLAADAADQLKQRIESEKKQP